MRVGPPASSSTMRSSGSRALNPSLNAFVAVDEDRARATADDVDAAVAAGRDVGPLAGIPIGVKDLEDAAGFVTTHGSAAFADDRPAGGRLAAGGPSGGRRVHRGGEDQHPRARLEGGHRQPGLRTDPQSLEPRPQPGWLVRGERGGHRFGDGSAGHRIGRRRLHPHPVIVLRPFGDEAVSRAGAQRWGLGAGLAQPVDQRGRWPAGWPMWLPPSRSPSDRIPTDIRSLPRPEASWIAALEDPKPPRRVAWSPTLGYAEVDARGAGDLRAGRRGAGLTRHRGRRGRHGVRRPTPWDEWLTLSGVYNLRTMDGCG